MALLTDTGIREALQSGEIVIDPLDEASLQPASYDLRLGDRGIITKQVDVEELRKRIQEEKAVPEVDVAEAGSIAIPAGSFALVVTKERIALSRRFAGHIG